MNWCLALLLIAALALLAGCATIPGVSGPPSEAVFQNSLARGLGYGLGRALPRSRPAARLLCASLLAETDPARARELLRGAVQSLSGDLTAGDLAMISYTIEDLLALMQIDLAQGGGAPTDADLARWKRIIGAFSEGVEASDDLGLKTRSHP